MHDPFSLEAAQYSHNLAMDLMGRGDVEAKDGRFAGDLYRTAFELEMRALPATLAHADHHWKCVALVSLAHCAVRAGVFEAGINFGCMARDLLKDGMQDHDHIKTEALDAIEKAGFGQGLEKLRQQERQS